MTHTEAAVAAPASNDATLLFDHAYTELAQALQEILSTTWQRDAVNARYAEYLALLQAVMSGQDGQAACAQAYAVYVAALQEALSAPPQQQRAVDAFDRYTRAVRDAWTSSDARPFTPESVAAIAQQMLTASSIVAGIAKHRAGTGADLSPPHDRQHD